MRKTHPQVLTGDSLANQIKDSVCKHISITPVEQQTIKFCRGPEDVSDNFIDVLSKYPSAVLRLPISTILLELIDENSDIKRLSKKRMKRILSKLGHVIKASLAQGDAVVRYRDTRFAILLINADETNAAKVCQRIKESIHRYCYFASKEDLHFGLEFAVSQHDYADGNDFADLVFGNEQVIRLAKALGDGAIVTRQDAREHFRNHTQLCFHLGELNTSDLLTVES